MLGATTVELTFWLCQIPWTFEGASGWDVLRVYYKVSAEDPWVLLHEYLDPVFDWEEQKLNLPNPSGSYYVAFEGQTRWGYGTCLDKISVKETGSQPMYVGEVGFDQSFSNFVPSGSPDVPILRVDFKVFGNTDSVVLDYINFNSLNTDDNDLITNGLQLYSTTNQTFDKSSPVGSATSFSSGVASFNGLNYTLPAGQSYLWLTCDVEMDAGHANILDVMVAESGIRANGLLYPASDQSPDGYREITKPVTGKILKEITTGFLAENLKWIPPMEWAVYPGTQIPMKHSAGHAFLEPISAAWEQIHTIMSLA